MSQKMELLMHTLVFINYICYVLLAASAIYRLLVFPLFITRLSKIPAAHPLCNVTSLWIYYIRWADIENRTIQRLHKQKGPILRIGPNELSVNCYEEGIKTIYGGGFEKTEFYPRRFANYDGVINIFTTLDSKSHSHRKRMVSNIYSKSFILSSPTVHTTSKVVIYKRLLPLIQQHATTGISIETLSLNYSYSMDAFTAYQFGLGLGTNFIQDVKTRDWYLGNYFAIRPYMFWIGDGYKIWSLLMRIGVNIIPTKVLDAFPEIQAYNLELCDKAEALLSDARALSIEDVPVIYSQERSAMRKDIDAKRFQNPHFLKTEQDYPRRLEIASDMFDMNAAALETSGITLTYLYYELSRHPELQTKLRQELLTLSPTFSFPVPEGQEPELPDSKEVDRLPLLDAILQETLRLYQAVPGRQPRITPAKGCTLAGYSDIPGGVVVQSYGSVLHRNPAVFPDPANWKPERWLNAGEEELKEMKRWFWAFGSGGRMCVGTHVAIHNMKSAIAAIYTNYTTTVVSAGDMAQSDGFMGDPVGKNVVLQFYHV